MFIVRLVNSLIPKQECGSHHSLDCTDRAKDQQAITGIWKSTKAGGAETVHEGEREGLLKADRAPVTQVRGPLDPERV